MSKALDDIRTEQSRALAQWGGPEHDDQHSLEEWIQCIDRYLVGAKRAQRLGEHERARSCLVKAGGLALSALESFDRLEEAQADE